MCTVLLPLGGYPIAVNQYIISYHIMRSGVSTSGPLNSTYTQQVKMVMLCHPHLIPSLLPTIKRVSHAHHPTQYVHQLIFPSWPVSLTLKLRGQE